MNELKECIMGILLMPGRIGTKYSFREIKKRIHLDNNYSTEELKNALEELEVSGEVFVDNKGLYRSFPVETYAQGVISINKHGDGFLTFNDVKYKIYDENLNGALDGDVVLVKPTKKIKEGHTIAKVDKIIKRKDGLVVVEIKVRDGQAYLEPFNAKLDGNIVINGVAMKPLVEGDRIQVQIDKKDGNTYYGQFVKYIGHKDDPDADIKMIALDNGIAIDFSEESLKEANNIPTQVLNEEREGRLDLTDELIFSIDGKDTKDRDDCISLRKKENGNYILGVHIADVSHYVHPGMKLWDEALNRGTSAYLVGTVIPMLPHKLSNGICSLNPGVDRLSFTCEMEINPKGQVVKYDFIDTIINSKKAMNYDDVNSLLEDDVVVPGYEPFEDNLRLMQELSSILDTAKEKRGYVNFGTHDIKISMDDEGQPKEIQQRQSKKAEKLIENFMLLAGECAASYVVIPSPYRIHDQPDEDRVEEAFDVIKKAGIRVKSTHEIINGKCIQQILEQVSDMDERQIVSNIILRAMKRAGYSVQRVGHFGLGLPIYGQFTSPIRRAPDLMMHWNIRLQRDNKFDITSVDTYYSNMEKFCQHATRKEQNADQAERDANQFVMMKYVSNHIGEKFMAHVTYVNSRGIFVKTDEGIEGKILPTDLEGDSFFYDDNTMSFKGKKSKIKIKIGSRIPVVAVDTKREYRTINFAVEPEDILVLKKTKHG